MLFRSVAEVLCEDGVSARLGTLIRDRFGTQNICIVTDPGIIEAGLLAPVEASLLEAGHSVSVASDVSPDPSDRQVLKATKIAADGKSGLVIGFGGGSAMDVAKLVAWLVASGDDLNACYGVDQISPRATGERAKLVQIPTTSGTGSEVTGVAIITTGEAVKKGAVDSILFADMAILDATLTISLPANQTAATAIDAMVHGIESFTSARLKNPLSDACAIQAISLIAPNLPRVMARPDDLEARRAILLGANLAGKAFANAPVGAVHALAYPVGSHFHVAHGLSNSLLLPHVLKFNAQKGGSRVVALYGEIAEKALGERASADGLIERLCEIIAGTGIEQRLEEVGIAAQDIDLLASDSMLQQRLLINNPVEVLETEAREIYEAAL